MNAMPTAKTADPDEQPRLARRERDDRQADGGHRKGRPAQARRSHAIGQRGEDDPEADDDERVDGER